MIEKILKNGLLLFGVVVAILIVNSPAVAQDDEITDDELMLYATVMNKIDSMKEDMKVKYNDLIKSEELMDEGRRFNELKSAKGDEAKLAEISATEEEIAVFDKIQEAYDTMVADFKEVYPTLIKDELGAAVYNKVKKGLKADPDLRTKYEEIVDSLKPEEGEDGDA
ncbi:hypothetical protein [Reichenbachiella sp. MALMAid0571]|uniref:hypothetical protein n=1 Tax=Reichenbachiella sp. MALMAid0571 TaxID=3143939 RepID=UPI0032DF0130